MKSHLMYKTKLYYVWGTMRDRCYCKNNTAYKNYGGRGIKICDEWRDFVVFYNWAVNSGYKEGLTLDRINYNGNYEPENCRWTDRVTQNNNRRNNRRFLWKGQEMTLAQICNLEKKNYKVVHSRLLRGEQIEKAIR